MIKAEVRCLGHEKRLLPLSNLRIVRFPRSLSGKSFYGNMQWRIRPAQSKLAMKIHESTWTFMESNQYTMSSINLSNSYYIPVCCLFLYMHCFHNYLVLSLFLILKWKQHFMTGRPSPRNLFWRTPNAAWTPTTSMQILYFKIVHNNCETIAFMFNGDGCRVKLKIMKQKCDNMVMKHEKWTSSLMPRLHFFQWGPQWRINKKCSTQRKWNQNRMDGSYVMILVCFIIFNMTL